MSSTESSKIEDIDEELYSRQLYVLGHDSMKKMMTSTVVVLGSDGLGQEICKNIILAGVKRILIYDTNIAPKGIYERGFYSTGDGRLDMSVLNNLKNINKYVSVEILEDYESLINGNFEVTTVVSVNKNIEFNIDLNRKLRNKNIKFVMANSRGFFGQIFCDFANHVVFDKNGIVSTGLINDITHGVVTLAEGIVHSLEEGDKVKISKSGNNADDFKECTVVSIVSNCSFEIDTSDFEHGTYEFEQIKTPKEFIHNSLQEAMNDKLKIAKYNYTNEDEIHNLFCGFEESSSLKNEFLNSENFLVTSVCSVIGGFSAQEVLKSVSGKFLPLNQFYYYHCDGLYDDNNIKEKGLSYLIGIENYNLLRNARIFIVGAGAIGCENMKNIAMSGIGVGGAVYITDMDSIEKSNLNRQFLFKEKDVGKMKSEAAVENICSMNSEYICSRELQNILAFTHPVSNETENIFSDQFFDQIDIVCNALDNVAARTYMDGRCVQLVTPMVDAGTLGTQGHVQVVVPFISESYSSTSDPETTSIPLCTIKSYPNCIEHTIEWATGEFDSLMGEGNNDESDENEELNESNNELNETKPKEANFDTKKIKENPSILLFRIALSLFNDYFNHSISKLLNTFPEDSLSKEGHPFWSPPKRLPHPIYFDVNDQMCSEFIKVVMKLYSKKFAIKGLSEISIEEYFSKIEFSNISTNNLLRILRSSYPNSISISFDKDSWHSQFVYTAANLRARVYSIKECSKHHIIGIAGRIIPAIATTTSIVSGLSILEAMKYLIHNKSEKKKDGFLFMKNSFLDLAHPMLASTEPVAPKSYSYVIKNDVEIKDPNNDLNNNLTGVSVKYTCWSRIILRNDTLQNIIEALNKLFNDKVSMVSCQNRILHWDFSKKYEENLSKKISDCVLLKDGQKWIFIDALTEDEQERCAIAISLDE